MRDAAAVCVLRIMNAPYRYYTPDELNYYMQQFPMPNEIRDKMKIEDDKIPIAGLDAPFEKIGQWLVDVVKRKSPLWPLCYLPLNMGELMQQNSQAVGILDGYLSQYGLGVMQRIEDDARVVRGVPCALMCLMVEFKEGVDWKG